MLIPVFCIFKDFLPLYCFADSRKNHYHVEKLKECPVPFVCDTMN